MISMQQPRLQLVNLQWFKKLRRVHICESRAFQSNCRSNPKQYNFTDQCHTQFLDMPANVPANRLASLLCFPRSQNSTNADRNSAPTFSTYPPMFPSKALTRSQSPGTWRAGRA
jgi:hypothetical protein